MSGFHKKKHFGQHFLRDANIARKVAASLTGHGGYEKVLEIGPGLGALTQYLLEHEEYEVWAAEVDRDIPEELQRRFPAMEGRIFNEDFLRMDLDKVFGKERYAVVGNFPYNISSRILFKVLDHKDQVPEVVGMFQKEVAERITAGPGSKVYGKLSVLLKAFYDLEMLFTVSPKVFDPPPKVKSAVVRLRRNKTERLDCDEALFFQVVKQAFQQRRKTLRNALKSMAPEGMPESLLLNERAEDVDLEGFIELTRSLEGSR